MAPGFVQLRGDTYPPSASTRKLSTAEAASWRPIWCGCRKFIIVELKHCLSKRFLRSRFILLSLTFVVVERDYYVPDQDHIRHECCKGTGIRRIP